MRECRIEATHIVVGLGEQLHRRHRVYEDEENQQAADGRQQRDSL